MTSLASEPIGRHRWLRDPLRWIAYLQVYGAAYASFLLWQALPNFARAGVLGWMLLLGAGGFYTICGVAGLALLRPYPWARQLVAYTQFPQIIQLHTQHLIYALTNGAALLLTWSAGGWLGVAVNLETKFSFYVRHGASTLDTDTGFAVNLVPLVVLYVLSRTARRSHEDK